jgi:thioredoxin-related protein
MTKKLLTLCFVLATFYASAQTAKINWISIEQAAAKAEQQPKKIFLDMYTDWCGWCTKMDQTTFSDPVIIDYINENFYAVKFDAERQDTVVFLGQAYVNANPGKKRSSHQLAQTLMSGKMSYPSYVFMSEELSVITVVPGYFPADKFEPVLHFFGKNAYQTTDWQTFSSRFKGTVKQ